MKGNFLILLVLLWTQFPLLAQKGIDGLIGAERKFADDCKEMGIRKSFMTNVDSNAVSMVNGTVVNAMTQLIREGDSPGVIDWAPSYAEIAGSGDWGYTTGNYKYRKSNTTDSISGAGQYTTLWHIDQQGKWKYLIDLGIFHKPVSLSNEPMVIDFPKIQGRVESATALFEIETNFIGKYAEDSEKAAALHNSEAYILNLNQFVLINSREAAREAMAGKEPISFKPLGIFSASSGDMFAVYGTISGSHDGAYLRIWRNERSGWRIALEVLKF